LETLKIVQVAHTFPPEITGLSHVSDMISRSLVRQGHAVEVVTLDASGKLDRIEDYEGVYVRRFSCLAPSNSYFLPSPRSISYLKSVEADIVHAHNIGALLVPSCWWAIRSRLDRISFVLSPHHHAAGNAWHTKMLWMPYRPLARHVVRSADAVHCVSEFEAGLVMEDFGVEPVVIPNGVADDVFEYSWRPPEDGLVLTYAGRVEKFKRVQVLVEAAAILLKQGFDFTLRIIGDGLELPNILDSSGQLGVKVEHYHFLPRRDYLKLLSTSSCFVNLSKYEAFSIVVAEAATMGLPVIASLPWGETFRRFGNVLLVDGGAPSEVAEAVSKAANMHFEGRSSFLSWDDVTRKLVQEVYVPSLERVSSE
jgi:glycosyltransferase involved in cell wall biosynthesis